MRRENEGEEEGRRGTCRSATPHTLARSSCCLSALDSHERQGEHKGRLVRSGEVEADEPSDVCVPRGEQEPESAANGRQHERPTIDKEEDPVRSD